MPLIRKPTEAAKAADTGSAIEMELALAGLRADQADERRRASRVVAGFPQAARALGDALAAETDPRVREAILTSLIRIDSSDSLEALLIEVRSDDAARRTGAMDSLKAMRTVLPAAIAALSSDDDVDARILACDLARELPADQATALLVEVLKTNTTVNVCAAAIDVIADIGSPGALPALRSCAEHFAKQPFLAFAIQAACERIGAQA